MVNVLYDVFAKIINKNQNFRVIYWIDIYHRSDTERLNSNQIIRLF